MGNKILITGNLKSVVLPNKYVVKESLESDIRCTGDKGFVYQNAAPIL
ncbi:hypothetical protein [Clostridium sp. WB02_MRS01]|nr:hypothetical protein [Clostridium sp. WB02_MRS01]